MTQANEEAQDTGGKARCRIVLAAPPRPDGAEAVLKALGGGDVASVIVSRGALDDAAFATLAKIIVGPAQEMGIAVLIEADSRIAGRSGADGLFMTGKTDALKDAITRFSPRWIVGYGGMRSRHEAMEAAELEPDFLMFGEPGGDIRNEAHPKNLALGQWCCEVMNAPVVVMAGSTLDSVAVVAASNVDFVCLGEAVFSHAGGPNEAIRIANEILDKEVLELNSDPISSGDNAPA